ncbi:MAG: AAA family ATPase, partial [Treponema sp.]|nr:AAA family ATPase [Treponema sp.]
MEYQYRNLSGFLKETLAARPLVYLPGPRQTGTSTLVQRLETGGAVNYMTLDSPLLLAGSKADPAAFVNSFRADALNIIDEVQLSPELFPYLKMAVDEQRLLGLSGEKS